METIRLDDNTDRKALSQRLAGIIEEGGLVCLPCNGSYRIVADLTNADAVMELMQSKRRTRSAPALIFIDDEQRLDTLAADLDPLARRVARALWPQALTLRVRLHEDMPRKIVKQLGGKKAKVGVRVPNDELARMVARKVGRPLLVSSANRQKKPGESSPAQVRKTFGARVDIFVDAGDIKKSAVSTVVDIADGELSIKRTGAVTADAIQAVMDG